MGWAEKRVQEYGQGQSATFLKSGAGICESDKFHEFRFQIRQTK